MKISKILVPAVALMATNNYVSTNNQVAVSCESLCDAGLSTCILNCTASAAIPLLALGCYSGCGIGYGACLALCAATK